MRHPEIRSWSQTRPGYVPHNFVVIVNEYDISWGKALSLVLLQLFHHTDTHSTSPAATTHTTNADAKKGIKRSANHHQMRIDLKSTFKDIPRILRAISSTDHIVSYHPTVITAPTRLELKLFS